jgi:hypothetical protein
VPLVLTNCCSLVALQAGGYSHPWESAYVLAQLIIGFFLLVAFVIWEWKFCKDPMVPHELFAGQRIVGMAYGIAFIAGKHFCHPYIAYKPDDTDTCPPQE